MKPASVQAWTELLRTPLPHLELDVFAQLHPVRVDQADGVTLLRIQPGQEVKRALAPWTRRFGTTVPVFTSLEAEANDLLGAPEEAARWLRERPPLCCAAPVLDDLLIAARGMTAHAATLAQRHGLLAPAGRIPTLNAPAQGKLGHVHVVHARRVGGVHQHRL